MTRSVPFTGAPAADYWALEDAWERRQFAESRWNDELPEDDEDYPRDEPPEWAPAHDLAYAES